VQGGAQKSKGGLSAKDAKEHEERRKKNSPARVQRTAEQFTMAVIASAARQSSALIKQAFLDCHVAALAMTNGFRSPLGAGRINQ
jgi:hypothetical protein